MKKNPQFVEDYIQFRTGYVAGSTSEKTKFINLKLFCAAG